MINSIHLQSDTELVLSQTLLSL